MDSGYSCTVRYGTEECGNIEYLETSIESVVQDAIEQGRWHKWQCAVCSDGVDWDGGFEKVVTEAIEGCCDK